MTPGSRYARHPGVGHKIKANRTNGTGRNQYGHIQGKEIQTENGREKDTKKQRHSKRTDTGNRRKAAGNPENTKQVTTLQTC